MPEEYLHPGLLIDTFDPRDVWIDEVLGADDKVEIPEEYRVEGLLYEPQGSYPFCVSFAVSTLLEWKYNQDPGNRLRFSQPHLFFHANGSKIGSRFRDNLDVAQKKGCIPYEVLPMPDVSQGRPKDWHETMRAEALKTPFTDAKLTQGYARVMPSAEQLKRKLLAHGPLLVGVAAGEGNYYSGDGVRVPGSVDDHAVLLAGWTKTHWIIFESLRWAEKAKGYVTLKNSYEFYSAFAITELPEDWRVIRDTKRSEPFAHALQHYGEVRSLEKEKAAAEELMKAFERFNNKSVFDAAGRFWTVLINARAYGGYNVSYEKNGQWMPGDLVNWVYQWRRDPAKVPFDLNKKRSEN